MPLYLPPASRAEMKELVGKPVAIEMCRLNGYVRGRLVHSPLTDEYRVRADKITIRFCFEDVLALSQTETDNLPVLFLTDGKDCQ